MTAPRTGSPSTNPIPVADLAAEYRLLKAELDPVVMRVLSGGTYVLGEETKAFETELAAYCQSKHAIGVNSGTDAILLALRALDIGPGDEVIVPAMTFFATVEPVIQLRARPIFADIDPITYTLSPADVRKRLTAKTKAILVVHLYGQTADLEPLAALAKEKNISLIEDMAQAIGAEYQGKKAGSFGKFACLSFYPTKNLGACGDGGAVLTSDSALASLVRLLRNHGQTEKYQYQEAAYNSRLDELQAAILRVKLCHLNDWNQKRTEAAAEYDRRLASLPVTLPKRGPDRSHTYHLYCIKTPQRDALQKFLSDRQISTGLHYPSPLHLQPPFQSLGWKRGDFPESEALAQQVISLPLHPYLSANDIGRVADAVGDFFKSSVRG